MPHVAKTGTGPNVPCDYYRKQSGILEDQMANVLGFYANKLVSDCALWLATGAFD
jgi:hypothetical protein